jgi:serine/threonine protein kinase
LTDLPARLATALADRYRIERELGQGGMATVYLAEDLKHKRKVALKVLKPELAAVLGAERFVQEITTTAALQHPHILPLFDSSTADGFLPDDQRFLMVRRRAATTDPSAASLILVTNWVAELEAMAK